MTNFFTRIVESSELSAWCVYQNKKVVLDDKMTGDEEEV
jgi:hypothetical protein